MEDILIVILIAVVASAVKVKKNTQSKKAIHFRETYKAMQASFTNQEKVNEGQLRLEEMQREMERHEKEQFAKEMNAAVENQKPVAQPVQFSFEGAHQHEGKSEAPCPAIEREMPRTKPATAKTPAAPTIPGLNLTFDRNSVLQGVVMSEILNRPRVGMRR